MIGLALLPALAMLVSPPTTPEEGCPSARQVTEAMQARIGPFLVRGEQTAAITRNDILRALLDVAPDGTVVRFSLVDARGETQLKRILPAPGPGISLADCVALADTVAAIAERYLVEIDYPVRDSNQSPAGTAPATSATGSANGWDAAPPRERGERGERGERRERRVMASLGVGWRMTTGGDAPAEPNGLEARLAGQVEVNRGTPRLALLLSLGMGQPLELDPRDVQRHVVVRRFPVRIGGVLAVPVSRGWLEPALQTGVDVLRVTSTLQASGTSASASVSDTNLAPVVEAALGYRIRVLEKIAVRPVATLGVALKSYDWVRPDSGGQVEVTLLRTARAYASFAIDIAWVFR